MIRWIQVVVTGLLFFPFAVPAVAQVNLGWNDTGPQMETVRGFLCDTNAGADTLVASFTAPAGVTKLVRLEAVIDFCSGPVDLPTWWQFDNCRIDGVTVTSSMGELQNWWNDYWQGRGTATVEYTRRGTNAGRFVVNIALDEADAGPLTMDQHYYAFRLIINHIGATGFDVCSGCDKPVCMVLNDIRLVWPGGEARLNGAGWNYALWQGQIVGCPFLVPVVPTTWSGIKALLD